MQRVAPWTKAAGVLAMGFTLGTATSVASAGEPKEQGGRNAEPAPRTGSGAHGQTSMEGSEQSASPAPRTASDMNQNPATGSDAQRAGDSPSQKGWASHLNRTQIEKLQRELSGRGLYDGAIDGVAGPQTSAALQQFQRQSGLATNAGLDAQTRRALGLQLDEHGASIAQTSSSPDVQRTSGREGQTPSVTGSQPFRSQVPLSMLTREQLRTLQTHLQQLGTYSGAVDGTLGEQTRSALQRFFQTQAELASRGIITDTTAGVFGLSARELEPAVGTTEAGRRSTTVPGSSGMQGTQSGTSTQPGGSQPSATGTPAASGTTRTGTRTQSGTNTQPSTRGSSSLPPTAPGNNLPNAPGNAPGTPAPPR